MLDYLIVFFGGIYVGTYYECRPLFSYLSTFIKTLAPNRNLNDIDDNIINITNDEIKTQQNNEILTENNKTQHDHEKNNKKMFFFW